MRSYPSINSSILFLGETRDSIMASEVLKVAANGHLVITTMHGADVPSSLRRFLNLAAGVPGANEQEVRLMFSSVFRLLVHQRLDKLPNGKKKISICRSKKFKRVAKKNYWDTIPYKSSKILII